MTKLFHGLSRFEILLKECLEGRALNSSEVLPQTFGYQFRNNPITGNLNPATIIDGFDALVDTMRATENVDGPADAGQTFFGQFIDHDITLDATSAIGSRIDPRNIRNIRTPNLDLDCVYGDGPEATPFLYSPDHEGFMLYGREQNPIDLPRNCKGRALIGDPRNDENVIVSQVHGAFIALHNILMTIVEQDGPEAKQIKQVVEPGVRHEVWADVVKPPLMGFELVRRFIRLHYQWLVLHEFLPAFVDAHIIGQVLSVDPFGGKGPIMPAEFSVAGYRFGHATVQPSYEFRQGVTKDLFDMLGFGPRDPDSDIEMARFFSTPTHAAQKARAVGTSMAATLFELPPNVVGSGLEWRGVEIPIERARKLALRNILRDRTSIEVVSGQQAARELGLPELAAPDALQNFGITKTPLWFYCLQEAQESGEGTLTGVGGTIVATVFARLLKNDPESILNFGGFVPWSGFGQSFSMGGLMAFVEQHRDSVAHREDLFCG